MECEKLGIPLYNLNSKLIGGRLDLSIDGADEIDAQKRFLKGGGGALLLEKIVAYASAAYVVVVDESKIVENLALKFPLPIEVIPDARAAVTLALESLKAEVVLREGSGKAGPVITDNGNVLLDIRFSERVDPVALELELNRIPGVVENGFFTGPSALTNPLAWTSGLELFIGCSGGKVVRR
jgi:ribose 5-phosphate isomerase A